MKEARHHGQQVNCLIMCRPRSIMEGGILKAERHFDVAVLHHQKVASMLTRASVDGV